MSYQPVRHDIHQIDLQKHGLIEASAGTGKTYAIENLVVRLLREQEDVDLENILLVTFTEKAASELKIRIREKLEAVLNHPDLDLPTVRKLRRSVDEFDRSAIHTIHGFCQTVLKDFAFENSAPFQAEVIPDGPLYEILLKEQMRREWPRIYGEDLEEILELSGFNKNKDRFLETIIRLAASFHPDACDRLLPDVEGRGWREIKEETVSVCMHVASLIRPNFSDRYGHLNFNAATKRTILHKMVVPVEAFFSKLTEDTFDLSDLFQLISRAEETACAGKKGLACLMPEKWNKGGPNLHVCPELGLIKEGLEAVSQLLKDLGACLAAETVHRLQAEAARTKAAHGWISYYDMLALVEKALSSDGRADLLTSLRDRFKAAFIDEFQDTDPIQWRIFKRIFIDGPDPSRNRLFVIGDPKQAIYAFRGADVYVYLAAKKEMEGLAHRGKAGLYSLSINWRSHECLIQSFNTLFCRDGWFKPDAMAGPSEIGYQVSEAPDPGRRLAEIAADDSGRPVLTIVDLSSSPSPRPARLRLARFIAQEIHHLAGSKIRLKEKGKDERCLGFQDMAILVRGKSDVPFVEDELRKQGIPYAFYKKPGLFASDEAAYLSIVFHAILDPGDASAVKKGLLTPFFGRSLQELYGYDDMPLGHPIKEILFQWSEYAMMRQWGALFQSLTEDSGLVARGAKDMGWDRTYANYRQIFEHLKEEAYRRNLDFRGLAALLDLYRTASWEAGEGIDIHQIETESGKVQIMTMHVSKGLQFPVVFVAGGLTQPMAHQDSYHVYHPVDANGPSPETLRIMDLLRSGGGGRHEIEKADEDKRLYYVAATRAQFKLYLPFYIFQREAPWLGPVCRLVSPALQEAFPREGEKHDVLWLSPDDPSFRKSRAEAMTSVREIPIPESSGFEDLLIPEHYEGRRIRVDSFSVLHHQGMRQALGPAEEVSFQSGDTDREPDEVMAAWDMGADQGEGMPAEVPGGIDVGLMFHAILEQMDYSVVLKSGRGSADGAARLLEDPKTRHLIVQEMATHRVDQSWEAAICRILWRTLTAVIPPLGEDFFLACLRREDRLHEAGFYYSLPDVAGAGVRPRLMRGFIDLIFRKDNVYYVADWKSNLLESGYDQESMARSMAEAGYTLQCRLYALAALRWLQQALGSRFNAEKDWGGVFYFYLRGMGQARGEGIYFVPPEQMGTLEQLEEEMGRILRG